MTDPDIPIERTNARAQYASTQAERLETQVAAADWHNPAQGWELGTQLAQVHATLVLAQEVSNLRQSLERLLAK